MKILFIGDISGRPGREMVKQVLPELRKQQGIDFVIANCENAAHGKGVTRTILTELQSYGIDFFTSGDHVWDQKEFVNDLYDQSLPIVRFYNYEGGEFVPGKRYEIIDFGKRKIVVAGFSGTTYMRFAARNPFWAADDFIKELAGKGIDKSNATIIIDFHGEATAEKLSFGEYMKNKVSAVLGTHTHVGTVDARIMGDSMAYVTDVGMTGPLDSSLWVNFEDAIHNFMYPNRHQQTMNEEGRRVFNSVLMEFEDQSVKIQRIDKII
jgi:metallophosphoesterase (TIGR00282 family)